MVFLRRAAHDLVKQFRATCRSGVGMDSHAAKGRLLLAASRGQSLSLTFQREELFAEVWASPLTTLAKKYGVSDNGIRKICKAMNIPLPRVGHWAKAAVGKAPPPPRLPAKAERTTFQSNPPQKSDTPRPVVDDDAAWLKRHLHEEQQPSRKIVVNPAPTNWHPAVLPLRDWLEACVTKYQKALKEKERAEKTPKSRYGRASAPDFSNWDIHANEPVLGSTHRSIAMRVSIGTYRRALAILNALAQAAKDRGFTVELLKGHERLRFSLESADLDLYITERLEDTFITVRNSWSNEPRSEKKKVPTGRLRLNLGPSYRTYQIGEAGGSPLEDELNRVFEYAYRQVVKCREEARAREIERQKAEIRRLEWEETERQRKAQEQQRAEEERRRGELLRQADGWSTAERIRSFVKAMDARIATEGSEKGGRPVHYEAWRDWALRVADDHDPMGKLIASCRDSTQ